MKHLLSLLFCFSMTAQAVNVRVIGTGGGNEEMLALSVFGVVKDYVRFCASQPGLCQLSEEQTILIQRLNQNQNASALKPTLGFHAGVSEKIIFNRTEGSISLAAEVLEDENSELSAGAWVFLAYAEYFLNENSSNLKKLAHSLYRNVTVSTRDLYIERSRLRFLEVQGSIEAAFIYSVKDKDQIQDITSDVVQSLKCGSGAHLLKFVSPPTMEGLGFTTDLVWRCGDQIHQALLVGQMKVDQSWGFQVFAKTTLALTAPSCGPLLLGTHHNPFGTRYP